MVTRPEVARSRLPVDYGRIKRLAPRRGCAAVARPESVVGLVRQRGRAASHKEAGMADRVLFIGWGQTVRGREERALEVFNETIGLYGRMQQDGRIEKFDVCLLDPHGGGLEGFVTLQGSAQQIAAVYEDEDFRRNMVDASLIV